MVTPTSTTSFTLIPFLLLVCPTLLPPASMSPSLLVQVKGDFVGPSYDIRPKCDSQSDCTHKLAQSVCVRGRCQCKIGYHYRNVSLCARIHCTEMEDCMRGIKLEVAKKLKCTSGHECVCKSDKPINGGVDCEDAITNVVVIIIATVVVMALLVLIALLLAWYYRGGRVEDTEHTGSNNEASGNPNATTILTQQSKQQQKSSLVPNATSVSK